MTWIKICGITNLEDGLTAVNAGADALGFVFYEESPRKVDRETVRQILKELPNGVETIGVFVDPLAEQMCEVVHSLDLTGIQMVMTWPPKPSSGMKAAVGVPRTMKAYCAMPAGPLVEGGQWIENQFPAHLSQLIGGIFLDSGAPQQPGGTGRVFDWVKAVPLVEQMSKRVKVIVAGGLTPSNVAEAMHILRPWGVDVSSGVEASPGKKDPDKVRAFVDAVRREDAKC
jgi:phosphoribosylanthranilate isomerase